MIVSLYIQVYLVRFVHMQDYEEEIVSSDSLEHLSGKGGKYCIAMAGTTFYVIIRTQIPNVSWTWTC